MAAKHIAAVHLFARDGGEYLMDEKHFQTYALLGLAACGEWIEVQASEGRWAYIRETEIVRVREIAA